MVRVVPSALTLGNLLMGFAAIFYASREPAQLKLFAGFSPLAIAAVCIFLGQIFDALDGRVARMTRQTSELGEQLDSMADMVTFGVAPAFLVIQLVGIGTPFFGEGPGRWDIYFDRIVLVAAAVYVACTALRLARFNIELDHPGESSHMSFKGLPSPAAAGTVAAFVLLHQSLLIAHPLTAKVTAVAMVAVMMAAAIGMVSTLRYVHLMNRFLRGHAPFHYVATAVLLLVPMMIVPQLTLAIAFGGYALSAPTLFLLRRLRPRPASSHSSSH
jgi:CDP-diacylglycerol--serine O-phosphatidyltransferase